VDKRENLLSLLRRKGFDEIPVEFNLCPAQIEEYNKSIGSSMDFVEYFQMPWRYIDDLAPVNQDIGIFRKYYDSGLKPGTYIDDWGVANEPGSEAAKHMTYMRHPLQYVDSIEEMKEYPFPDFQKADVLKQKSEVEQIHARGLAACGSLQCTVWETSWYIRSMEELMMDMMTEDIKAVYLLDRVTELACLRAQSFAEAGADILFLGDDIGMQSTILMSEELYINWLKPRLKKVIDAARKIKPDIIVSYHSCGFVAPFIPHLIEAGIDVLNPVQPECMNFKEIYENYGDRLSFHGTIGTQSVMPFGTPEDVRKEVFKNLSIAGSKGGLFVAPTHVLEPEVPWENIMAYVKACRDFVG
jgi:uroporphyrinogen decarboxylase